jgi:hypothetical protein
MLADWVPTSEASPRCLALSCRYRSRPPNVGPSEVPIPSPVKYGIGMEVWSPLSALMLRLAARPMLHSLLELLVSAALPVRSLNRLLGSVSWVYFVGTGHDYIGFPLLRFARSEVAVRLVSRSRACERANEDGRPCGLQRVLPSFEPRIFWHRLHRSVVLFQAGHLRDGARVLGAHRMKKRPLGGQ